MNGSTVTIPVSSRKEDLMSADVKKALCYLDAHFTEPLSIEILSSELYISRYHLMREFKKQTGTTVHEYLTKCRMNQAVFLIRSGMCIQDVSEAVGYSDYSLFYKNFVRYTGMSPREFKEHQASGLVYPLCRTDQWKESMAK